VTKDVKKNMYVSLLFGNSQLHGIEWNFVFGLEFHNSSMQWHVSICFGGLQLQHTVAHDFFGWEFIATAYNETRIGWDFTVTSYSGTWFGWEFTAPCNGTCLFSLGHLQLQHTMAHDIFVLDFTVATYTGT